MGLSGLALVLTVALGACDLLDPSPDATVFDPPATGDECENISSLSIGSMIYRCACASCHGLDGVPLAGDVTDIRGFTDEAEFRAALTLGPGKMPAFPALDSAQRLALFEYVRDSLGK